MFRKLALASLTFVIFGLVAATPTYAGAIQLTSPGQLTPGGTTVVYPGAPLTMLPSPLIISAGGNTVTFTTATGAPFVRQVEGPGGFGGDFPPGTQLILTNGPNGPLTISFATGVGELGLLAQNLAVGAGAFTFTAFNGATALATYSVPADGFASFIGVRATDGDVITRLVVSGASFGGPPASQNNFAISPVTFGAAGTQPIPEPATMTLLGIGLAGVGAAIRRRRKA